MSRFLSHRRRCAPGTQCAQHITTALLSLAGSVLVHANDGATIFDIPRLETLGSADGFAVDLLVPVTSPLPARDEFGAALRLGWNERGLLVSVSVTSREWLEADTLDALWSRDSIELYLAPLDGTLDRCQWGITPGLDPRFPDPRVLLNDQRKTAALRQLPAEPTVACERTADGCRFDVLLPWQALAVEPAPGREVAFQVMVNDHPRAGHMDEQRHLVWYPRLGAYSDVRKLHRLRLAERPHPEVRARLLGGSDHRNGTATWRVIAPAAATGQAVRVCSAKGELAAGLLRAGEPGYAVAELHGAATDAAVVWLELAGRRADDLPLVLAEQPDPGRVWTVETAVAVETRPPAVALTLPTGASAGYRVSRRRSCEAWQTLAEAAPPGLFRDAAIMPGTLYEYGVQRLGATPGSDYFCAGSAVSLCDRRGTVLLLVEKVQAAPLAAELLRLQSDLIGDGWRVVRHDLSADLPPPEVKRLIQTEVTRAEIPVESVFLLGHIAVPYAGNLKPDGHEEHAGAWPADVYYGALEGPWTDDSVIRDVAGRQRNVPGDGKFDQSVIPGRVALAVGRVDFHDLRAFGVDATTLLRRYLDRNHAYRHLLLPVLDRGLVQNGFPDREETFAHSGWQNFHSLVGAGNVAMAEWPNLRPDMHLLFYGCGAGGGQSMAGFGSTATLVETPLNAVFTMLFGSMFGDWDTRDNLMRAALANGALTCGWAGRPHWCLHPMAMGATIGDCLRLTQNNTGDDYQPVGSSPRGVHIALLGDTTLRLHRVAPPTALNVQAGRRGCTLRWTASAQPVSGYHVYRADAAGRYERLTSEPVSDTVFLDPAGGADHDYQVRAVALQTTPAGDYYNASQGVFCCAKRRRAANQDLSMDETANMPADAPPPSGERNPRCVPGRDPVPDIGPAGDRLHPRRRMGRRISRSLRGALPLFRVARDGGGQCRVSADPGILPGPAGRHRPRLYCRCAGRDPVGSR